jgi:hypothetical protein
METSTEQQPDIDVFVRVIQLLETNQPINCNDDYNQIRLLAKLYLKNYCNHSIITDYIDTDVDNGGETIKYCEKCYMTYT